LDWSQTTVASTPISFFFFRVTQVLLVPQVLLVQLLYR
jgi:hypothetical protein